MKKFFVLFGVVVISTLNAQDFVKYYIDKYKDISIEEMNKTGIPASITLAQGMLESNWGRSELSTRANNHFGIKCGNNWTGNTMYWTDDEYVNSQLVESCFRSYGYAEESFYDHSYFITSKSRYETLFTYDVTDYQSWSKGLQDAGYATDPNYAQKLIQIIEKYGLYEYDIKYMPVNRSLAKAINTQVNEKNYSITYINGSKVVIAKRGDSPVSISKSIGILAEDILKYNDNIKRKYQIFDEGDLVYLEKKSKKYKGNEDNYISGDDETLEDVSRKFGIDLKYLCRINNISKSRSLKKGQKIKLTDKGNSIDDENWVVNNGSDSRFLFEAPLTPKN
jgi:hypothetical protein